MAWIDDEEREADRIDELATQTADRFASAYPEDSPQANWMAERVYKWSVGYIEKRKQGSLSPRPDKGSQ